MIGISIIVLIVLYLFVSFKGVEYVYDKSQKKRYAILAILFFILLPTWDVIIGKIYFDHLCKTEGGLKMYESVQADGFLDKSQILIGGNKVLPMDIKNAKRFLDYGFKFYEVVAHNGKIVHFFKDESGSVIYVVGDRAEAEYEYVLYEKDKIVSYVLGIQKVREKLFRDIQNKDIAVQSIWFIRDGWVGRIMKHFIGMGLGEGCLDENTILNFEYKLLKGDFNGK